MRLNGKDLKTAAVTLDALLSESGYGETKVATALNGAFVPARSRATQALTDGDQIEVVAARQGG